MGTKSNQALAKGHVLFQKRLGTAAMPIKGGTQEAKFKYMETLGKGDPTKQSVPQSPAK